MRFFTETLHRGRIYKVSPDYVKLCTDLSNQTISFYSQFIMIFIRYYSVNYEAEIFYLNMKYLFIVTAIVAELQLVKAHSLL